MNLYKSFIPVIAVILFLASCDPAPPAVSKTAPPTAAKTSVSAAAAPSASASETYNSDSKYPEASPVDPGSGGYGIIPGSLPLLTKEDISRFDPEKVYSYLSEDNALSSYDYSYDISKAEIINGGLFVFLTIEISLGDVNTAYKDLKTKHSLTDDYILSIPAFSGCIIKDGIMYADNDAMQSRMGYDSYEDWQKDGNGFANSLDGVKKSIMTEPVPVSGDADIVLYNFEGSGEYTRVPMDSFKFFLLNDDNKTEASDGSEYSLSFLYFKYLNGKILAVYQGEHA